MSETNDVRLTREILKALAEPFELGVVKWKPQVVKNGLALAVAYIDARDVQDRLDAVAGGDWESRMHVIDNGHVLCDLTVCGVTRSDVGDCDTSSDRVDPLKAATSDAIKRAAVSFGVARYLYALPLNWIDYDERNGRFAREPELPAWALPEGAARNRAERRDAPPATPHKRRLPQAADEPPPGITPHEVEQAEAEAIAFNQGGPAASVVTTIQGRIAERLGGREPRPASEKQLNACARLLRSLFPNATDDDVGRAMRRQLIEILTGVKADPEQDNWERLAMHEAGALIDWAKAANSWEPSPDAISDAAAILAEFGEQQGQQALPLDEMSMGDKVLALIGRCWTAYTKASGEIDPDMAVDIAAELFPDGYEKVDDLPAVVIGYFDRELADHVAEEIGANLPNAAQTVGAITEAAGRAGQHTTVSALQARANAVRTWVQSLVQEGVPF